MRAPGCRCGRIRSSSRPCTESSAVCGNDQPSRAAARLKADGAGTTIISRASIVSRQHRADAVMERIARGEHADLPAAMTQHFVGGAIERARPRPRRAANERRRQAEMAPAAEHDFGRADQPARHRAQAFDAVLADADDGQPARRCGSVARDRIRKRHIRHATRPHSRRHHGSALLAERLAGRRGPRCDAVARRPHRLAGAAAGAGSQRRFWRRRRARRLFGAASASMR